MRVLKVFSFFPYQQFSKLLRVFEVPGKVSFSGDNFFFRFLLIQDLFGSLGLLVFWHLKNTGITINCRHVFSHLESFVKLPLS